MIISRGRSILKLCTKTHSLLTKNQLKNYVPKKWHGSYFYRSAPEFEKISQKEKKHVEYLGAFVWWWILWHLFTEYESLLGAEAPDPSKWTDEELGIPPL